MVKERTSFASIAYDKIGLHIRIRYVVPGQSHIQLLRKTGICFHSPGRFPSLALIKIQEMIVDTPMITRDPPEESTEITRQVQNCGCDPK